VALGGLWTGTQRTFNVTATVKPTYRFRTAIGVQRTAARWLWLSWIFFSVIGAFSLFLVNFSDQPQVVEQRDQVVHRAFPAGQQVQDLPSTGLAHCVERIRRRCSSCHD